MRLIYSFVAACDGLDKAELRPEQGMRAKQSASWKSSVSKLYDNIDFTIEKAERLAYRLLAFGSTLYLLWTIFRHHR
jgi:hypothetical protein